MSDPVRDEVDRLCGEPHGLWSTATCAMPKDHKEYYHRSADGVVWPVSE